MNLRLSTAAGFLAAATLLSGSAFAFAPQFNDELPTVIITDEIKAPSGGTFDPDETSTRYIFRFTDAYDLFDYIDLESATAGEVKMLFTEYPDDSSGVPVTGGNRIMLINDELAAEDVPADATDFAAAPVLGNSLTFWNRDFTPETLDVNNPAETGTAVGSITGHNVLSEPQSRLITMFLAGGPSTEVSDPKSFFVITTVGEGDSLSAPAAPTSPWVSSGTVSDFSGWTPLAINSVALIPVRGAFSETSANFWWDGVGPAPTEQGGNATNALGDPNSGTTGMTAAANGSSLAFGTNAPSGTTSLSMAISNDKIGFAILNGPNESTMEANKLYRLRSRISSASNDTREEYRVRFGGTVGTSISTNVKSPSTNPLPTISTTPVDHYSYLLTKGTGTTNVFNIAYDLLSEGQSQNFPAVDRGQSILVTEYELSVADRADLGVGTELLNRGGAVDAEASEVAPVYASPTPIAAIGDVNTVHINSSYTAAFSASDDKVVVTLQNPNLAQLPAGANGFATFSRVWFPVGGSGDMGDASNTGPFQVQDDKLYVADIWMSSTSATTQPQYPDARLGLQWSSQYDSAVYTLNPAAPTGIATTSKAYHVVMQPQTKGTTFPTPSYGHVTIDFLGSSERNTHSNAPVNITIDRIQVTEYDSFN